MTKKTVQEMISKLLLKIRQEQGLSQEVMADAIGVSKKTYIQLEKQRVMIGWSETVCVCTIFQNSEIISETFGEDVSEILQVVALQKVQRRQLPTLGGTIWWKTIKNEKGLILQQHKLTNHYRILDKDHYRLFFTLSKTDAENRYDRYLGK